MPARAPRARARPHARVHVGADYDIHHQDRLNIEHEAPEVHEGHGGGHGTPIVVGGEHDIIARPRIRVRAEPEIIEEPAEHGEHGEHREHGAEHGEHGVGEHEHDLPQGLVDTGHAHEFPFDPSKLPYAEFQVVAQWRLPARLSLPSQLKGEPLANKIEQGINEDVRRAEVGYETAQATAEKLTTLSKGVIMPLLKDTVTVPFKLLRSTLSFIFPFRIFGPTSITSPFTESRMALKLRARKARADAREAYGTMMGIQSLKPGFEGRLKSLSLAIDQARTQEERVAAFSALNTALNEYHAGYGRAIGGRFKEYNPEVLFPWEGPKLLPISDHFAFMERGSMKGVRPKVPRRLKLSRDEIAALRAEQLRHERRSNIR